MGMENHGRLALLFDLDGTLIDSIELILAGFRHAFTANGLPALPDAEWLAGVGMPLLVQLRGQLGDEEMVTRVQESYRAFQREHHDLLLREYGGVRETISSLASSGHPMAIVTSKGVALAERALGAVGLAPFFPLIIGLESSNEHKPHPEPVLTALGALGATAANAAFIGDSPHDIAAGRAAGVLTIGALWGPFDPLVLERAGADYLIESITALPALVDEIQRARAGDPIRVSG
jgi:pyrophosphatase PpaX